MEFLITTIISLFGNIFQFLHNINQNKKYKEELIPEIELNYKHYSDSGTNTIIIENIGLVDCADVWAEERIFLIINENVFEGEDIPHFNFIVNKGSLNKIWDISKKRSIKIEQEKFQNAAFECLKFKFDPIIIVQWNVSYAKEGSKKKYQISKYFHFDCSSLLFEDLEQMVGGGVYKNQIKYYLKYGEKQTVNIFQITGDFELNSINNFIVNPDYSITHLYPWTRLSLDQLNDSIMFHYDLFINLPKSDEIQDSTLKHTWEFKNNFWTKSLKWSGGKSITTGLIRPPSFYLNKSDAKRVNENPLLLKYNDPNRKKPNLDIKEIQEKVKQNYEKISN